MLHSLNKKVSKLYVICTIIMLRLLTLDGERGRKKYFYRFFGEY